MKRVRLNEKAYANLLFKILCALTIFTYSLMLGPYVINGDQGVYRSIYENIGNLPFSKAYAYYLANIDSKEFVHFVLSWIFSYLNVNKDLFIAIFNALLAYMTAVLCLKLKASKVITFLLITTCFYFHVLYLPAERLKFGMLFFIMSLIYINKKKTFYSYFFLASLSHVQVLISYISMFFYKVMLDVEAALKRKVLTKSLLLYSVFAVLVAVIMGAHIYSKLLAYMDGIKLFDVLKMLLILFLSLYYSQNKRRTMYMFIPLLALVFVIGSDRIFMLGYLLFLYNALQINRGVNVGVSLSLVYFAIKSYFFIINVVEYGTPFPI